tara:strand:- start:792 stop:932 length:141 start_codon:yes stop_codon:yes gene_type:complete
VWSGQAAFTGRMAQMPGPDFALFAKEQLRIDNWQIWMQCQVKNRAI